MSFNTGVKASDVSLPSGAVTNCRQRRIQTRFCLSGSKGCIKAVHWLRRAQPERLARLPRSSALASTSSARTVGEITSKQRPTCKAPLTRPFRLSLSKPWGKLKTVGSNSTSQALLHKKGRVMCMTIRAILGSCALSISASSYLFCSISMCSDHCMVPQTFAQAMPESVQRPARATRPLPLPGAWQPPTDQSKARPCVGLQRPQSLRPATWQSAPFG